MDLTSEQPKPKLVLDGCNLAFHAGNNTTANQGRRFHAVALKELADTLYQKDAAFTIALPSPYRALLSGSSAVRPCTRNE